MGQTGKADVSVPEGLSALEYARHIIEYELGGPKKTNLEMIAECIEGISTKKGLPMHKAFKYLARAISLHEKQSGKAPGRLWFLDMEYYNVRPPKEVMDRHRTLQQIEADSEKYHQHGCQSGWVMTPKGAIRCEQCR